MEKVGSLTFEIIRSAKGSRLRILGRQCGLETLMTDEERLALSAYLAREVVKLQNEKERR